MKIQLKNIGIVQDSTIALDGLTVITGKNNSGKSTVGKTVYSLLDAVSDLREKAELDKKHYVYKSLLEIGNSINFFNLFNLIFREQDDNLFQHYPALDSVVNFNHREAASKNFDEEFAREVEKELQEIDFSVLEKNDRFDSYAKRYLGGTTKDAINMFELRRKEALSNLRTMFNYLVKDPELSVYARESIEQTLKVEFSNQIQPVKSNNVESEIKMMDDNSTYFNINIQGNHIIDDAVPAFIGLPYKKVYLVDNPFVIDEIGREPNHRKLAGGNNETFLDANRIVDHNKKLKRVLQETQKLSVFEQTVLKDSLEKVEEKINKAIPGDFDFSADGKYYVQNGVKLQIANLATGSKMFSIIKILLEKGELTESTMLVLDEPEAHLHPMWQNLYAEMIALLVKELGIKILLTSHSSNFVLALDAFMRKYSLQEKTNFYQTDTQSNGFVSYRCVNNDMGMIYQDFTQYLSEMNALREKYLYDIEG